MKVLAWVSVILPVLALGGAQDPAVAPQKSTYTNENLGISVSHPASWQISPKKSDVWITIPTSRTGSFAALSLVAARFNADTEIWQKSQENITTQMGMEIVRQWKEEILGVPLLLTKFRSGPGKLASALKAVPGLPADQPLLTLVGLVYSATPRKLLFRLSAAEADYDEVELALRQVLETMRTTDGSLPTPEDPNRKPETIPETGAKVERPPTRTAIGVTPKAAAANGPEKAPKRFETTAAARKVVVCYPEGWAVETPENGGPVLRHEASGTVLKLGVFSTLDSESPIRALLRLSAESLKEFSQVDRREETVPAKNRAGATVTRVWREGASSSGAMTSFEAIAGSTDYYVVLTWKHAGKLEPAVRKAIESLLDAISVEPMV